MVIDKSNQDYLYYTTIIDKQTNQTVFTSSAWEYNFFIENDGFLPYMVFDKNIFKKSGKYEIIIQPLIKWNNCPNCNISAKEIEKYYTRHTLSITLENESYSKRELLTYAFVATLVIGLLFLMIFYYIRKRNKKNLSEKEQQKNIAKLQLGSIRSQLNPHFLFNALSGIQNLMNKNEIDNANKYLSKFARLTRNILNDKELISLYQEKSLLDDYLQMEQLRFGFAYNINVDDDLDLRNIEIPSMLLQPFLENAVKHGISLEANNGKITVEFIRDKRNLLLMVKDNGIGFDSTQKSFGLGLSLSNNRIALLNNLYKENHFLLEIQSNAKGTIVNITLTDWL
ncbi:sensor histidine kinase [Pedobacter sp. Leaf132]|uniref:sensor histidine kinase n=1 Tax=Pedobacter sp. Leaf132 TaxID=2876557 RepID=UPI001E64B3FB|nr:histidine kinase [Pedobacter sp. Leaf132]